MSLTGPSIAISPSRGALPGWGALPLLGARYPQQHPLMASQTRHLAAAVVALAVAAAAVVGMTRQQQAFGAAAGAAVDRAAATLTADHAMTSAQAPWRQVGPGWTLAEFTTGTYKVARPVTLYLLSPAGRRYQIYRWPAGTQPWELVGWSGDKQRVLLEQSGGKRMRMHQLWLTTGTVTTFTLPRAAAEVLGYTRPAGDNILIADHGIVRYSLTSRRQAQLIGGISHIVALSAANGLSELVNGGTGLELVSNAGGLIRRLPVPGADAAVGGCSPVRWWTSAVALATCMPTASQPGPRLWLVPVSGAPPTALTPLRSGAGPDYGDLDAWRFPSGLYVEALGACGARFIGRQAANGTVTMVNVPGSTGNNVVVATSGHRMLVREFPGCTAGSSLAWFNPATRRASDVLPAPASGDGVISVLAYS
jgi:hypothetical protein